MPLHTVTIEISDDEDGGVNLRTKCEPPLTDPPEPTAALFLAERVLTSLDQYVKSRGMEEAAEPAAEAAPSVEGGGN